MKAKKAKKERKGKLRGFIKKHKVVSAVIALALVCGIVAGSLAIAGNKSKGTEYSFVRTTTLVRGTLEDTVSTTGTVKSARTSNVTTSLNYTIKTVNVSVGDVVQKGDVIAVLDTEELEKQIDKESSNLSKQKSAAQSAYDKAKSSYDSAKSDYDDYSSTYNTAKSAYKSAKTPYDRAVSALKSYQSAYDKALSAYNAAGAKYIKAQSAYTKALSTYKKSKTSSNKSKLISAANAYMKAAQDYLGKCAVGSYDISDSSSSTAATDASKTGGMTTNTTSSSSVNVTKTADKICSEVVSSVKTLTGKTLSTPSGKNTLYKLTSKATALKSAKEQCNLSSLESAYTSAKSTYEEAKQNYSQLKNALSQAQEQLDSAKEELENASSSDTLDELYSQLEECSLKAEQSGTVTALNATVGSGASMDAAVATIQDLDKLTVAITIEEADINNVSLGMTCRITSDAGENAVSGTLTQINPVSSDGSFGATVTINETSDELYIGMNASVDIIVNSSDEVYQVPIDAVGTEGDTQFVYRKTGGEGTDMQFERVTVTTGDSNDYYIEINSSELSEGDVIRSSADLSEGIETVSSGSNSTDSNGGLFASLFGGGGMSPPSGGMPSGDMPQKSSSDSSSGGFTPPSGGMPGGNNG